jgi:hypothetical protein
MFSIIINIINIIILININKFRKKILLLLKKIIDLIWRVKLKIIIIVNIIMIIIIIINKFEKKILKKNHKFELKGLKTIRIWVR